MKKVKVPLYMTGLGIALANTSFAQQPDLETRVSAIESKLNDSSTKTARGTYGANLAQGSANLQDYGFYVSADAILFHLYQDNSGYASIQPGVSGVGSGGPTPPAGFIPFHSSNFNWDFGFKTGLGFYSPHDFWQTGFEFTYFQTQTKAQTAAGSGQSVLQANYTMETAEALYNSAGSFSTASDHWSVTFYNLDWKLGKNFFVSKYLSILPEIGVKTAWFYQNRNLRYDAGLPTYKTIDAQDNYVGVGPKMDVLAKFFLTKNFSILGGVDVALLCATNSTSYDAVDNVSQGFGSGLPYSYNKKKHHISPYLGLNIGLAYDTNFQDDSFNFGVKVAYEQQYYNKASRLIYADEPSAFDVSMQGVDVSFIFSF